MVKPSKAVFFFFKDDELERLRCSDEAVVEVELESSPSSDNDGMDKEESKVEGSYCLLRVDFRLSRPPFAFPDVLRDKFSGFVCSLRNCLNFCGAISG